MNNTPAAADRDTTDPYVARCRCGTSLADGAHRVCAGAAALNHSARVEDRANLLLSKLRAIHLMGTLNGGLQPLSATR